jgi:hypothetical protein
MQIRIPLKNKPSGIEDFLVKIGLAKNGKEYWIDIKESVSLTEHHINLAEESYMIRISTYTENSKPEEEKRIRELERILKEQYKDLLRR